MALGIATVCRRNLQIVVVIDVAGSAGHVGVACREREPRRAVVEFRSQPTIRRVAGLAGGREVRARVIGIRSGLKVLEMAGDTLRGKTLILAHGGALVAFLARYSGMRAEQRETVLVVFELLCRDVPAQYGVAPCAVRPHLPLVDVGVAVLAVLARIRNHEFDVALRAFHFFVHAAKRVLRFIVIELENLADGPPRGGGVAILARNVERAVGAFCGLPLHVARRSYTRALSERKGKPAQGLDEREINRHHALDSHRLSKVLELVCSSI